MNMMLKLFGSYQFATEVLSGVLKSRLAHQMTTFLYLWGETVEYFTDSRDRTALFLLAGGGGDRSGTGGSLDDPGTRTKL